MKGLFPGRTTAEAAVKAPIDPKYLEEIRHGRPWFPQMAYGVRSTQAHTSSASEIAIIVIGTCALVHPSSVEDRRFEGSDFSTDSVAMAGKFIGPGPEFPFGRSWPATTAGL